MCPPLQFLVTQMGPAGTVHPLGSLQADPGKTGGILEKVRILRKVSCARSPCAGAGAQRKVTCHHVGSFPNSGWQEKTRGLSILSLPGIAVPSLLSHIVC